MKEQRLTASLPPRSLSGLSLPLGLTPTFLGLPSDASRTTFANITQHESLAAASSPVRDVASPPYVLPRISCFIEKLPAKNSNPQNLNSSYRFIFPILSDRFGLSSGFSFLSLSSRYVIQENVNLLPRRNACFLPRHFCGFLTPFPILGSSHFP